VSHLFFLSVRHSAAAFILFTACGSSLRTVTVGTRGSAGPPPAVVDSAPPPPKVEIVPADPGKPCEWLDGRWEWADETWVWTPGTWVSSPPGCHYAPPQALWVPAAGRGLLFYLAGRWYRDTDGTTCTDAVACSAKREK
jgi:hypothetical protein